MADHTRSPHFAHTPTRHRGDELSLHVTGDRNAGLLPARQRAHAQFQVSGVTAVRSEEVAPVGIETMQKRDAFDDSCVEDLIRVERLEEHDLASRENAKERHFGEPKRMKKWQIPSVHVGRGNAMHLRPLGDIADDRMVVHSALWKARRPRRVDDNRRITGIDRAGSFGECLVGDNSASGEHGRPWCGPRTGVAAEHNLARDLGPEVSDFVDHRGVIDGAGTIAEDNRRAVGLVDGVLHIFGAVAGIERHGHGPDCGNCIHQEQPLGPIRHPHRDLVARLDAARDQAFCDTIDLVGEGCVCPTPGAKHERLVIRP